MSMAEDLDEPIDGEEDADAKEARARASGWRPFAEWTRAPEDWKDVDEYLELVETEFPVAREMARRLGKNNARLERQVQGLTQQVQTMAAESMAAIRDMGSQLRLTQEQARKQARAELLAQREGAVEAGDAQTFRQIEAQIAELDQQAAPPPPPPPSPAAAPAGPPPADRAILDQWVADNPWYLADQALRTAMIQHHSAVRASRPRMPLAEQLALAKRRVAEDMPDAFEPEEIDDVADPPPRQQAQQRRLPPAVSRPSGAAPPAARRSIWDQITDATEREGVKQQYERFKSLNNDPDMPASEYIALYLDPHADVIALRKQRPKKA